jgi:hypothetical protein
MFCIFKICRYTHRRIAREREREGERLYNIYIQEEMHAAILLSIEFFYRPLVE